MKIHNNEILSPETCLLVLVSLIWVAGGCVSYQGQKERDAQVRDFMETLSERRAALPTEPISLEQSVALAMTANYDIRLADLDVRMAALGKNITFAQFLPQVTASANWTGWDKQPIMQDKTSTGSNVSIGMPLVVPSIWFLYASKGEQAAQAAARAHYVRQTICLQTMTAYFNCKISADEVEVIAKQVETAGATLARVSGLADEGLARDWEAKQAAVQLAAREADLARARRNDLNRKGSLLNLLGLPPGYSPDDLKLSRDTPTALSETNSVESLVLQALSSHPELEIADRNIVISKNDVRRAIAAFLPSISAFGTLNWSSDRNTWTANRSVGFQGAWDAFNAFATVGVYKLAKAEKTKGTLAREQTFLRIMLDVMVARHIVDDAHDFAEVLAKTYEASKLKYEDYRSRQLEGLIPLSDALDAEAAMSQAELTMLQSRYQEQIAWAALKLAMGILEIPEGGREISGTPDPSDPADSTDSGIEK